MERKLSSRTVDNFDPHSSRREREETR